MKNDDIELADDLRPEYDLPNLRVRRVGSKRKTLYGEPIVRLAPDVAAIFPDSDSVNEALRFLIRVTRENHPTQRNP